MQVNLKENKIDRKLNLLMEPTVLAGSRIHPKNLSIFLFPAVGYNVYLGEPEDSLGEVIKGFEAGDFRHWPGLSLGFFGPIAILN